MVMGIIGALLSIGSLFFNRYVKSYNTDAETRLIYSELLKARAKALYERRTVRVKLFPSCFEVYSSATDSGVAPTLQQALHYPIVWNKSGNNVDFDGRGMALNSRSICVGEGDGSVNSIVIAELRVRIGVKDKGGQCGADSITVR